MKTLKELARQAIEVQDAVNPVALATTYADVVRDLRKLVGDFSLIRRHPVNCLWVSKLHELANMGLSNEEEYSKAYLSCKEMSES